MQYVYLLRSKSHPKERYVGCITDLKQRILEHNQGHSPHTAKFTPWELVVYLAFNEKQKGAAFEKYLESGSGRAFAIRHFY